MKIKNILLLAIILFLFCELNGQLLLVPNLGIKYGNTQFEDSQSRQLSIENRYWRLNYFLGLGLENRFSNNFNVWINSNIGISKDIKTIYCSVCAVDPYGALSFRRINNSIGFGYKYRILKFSIGARQTSFLKFNEILGLDKNYQSFILGSVIGLSVEDERKGLSVIWDKSYCFKDNYDFKIINNINFEISGFYKFVIVGRK